MTIAVPDWLPLSSGFSRVVNTTRCNPSAVAYALVLAINRAEIRTKGRRGKEAASPINPSAWNWARIDGLIWDENQLHIVGDDGDHVFTGVHVCQQDIERWCESAETAVANAFAETPPSMGGDVHRVRKLRKPPQRQPVFRRTKRDMTSADVKAAVEGWIAAHPGGRIKKEVFIADFGDKNQCDRDTARSAYTLLPSRYKLRVGGANDK
jgi:hypothetical protein